MPIPPRYPIVLVSASGRLARSSRQSLRLVLSSADSPVTGISADLFHESQVGGKSAKTTILSELIVSKGPSVAVLPVTNPAKATALEPVAATIAQQLASSLGKFSTLRVMPRATAANFL
jgi:hypothetical protein